MSEPAPVDLVRELREVLGLSTAAAMAAQMTPKAAWEEAIERVRDLMAGRGDW